MRTQRGSWFKCWKNRDVLGEDHADTLRCMGDLAVTYMALGRLSAAEELLVVAIGKQMKLLGQDHLETLHAMTDLAWT